MAEGPLEITISGDAGSAFRQHFGIDSLAQANEALANADSLFAAGGHPWAGDALHAPDRETFDWAAQAVQRRYEQGIYKDGELAKARVKPNHFPRPGDAGNTEGIIVPQTDPAPPGGATNPPVQPETPEERSFLEQAKGGMQQSIDDWVASKGDSKLAMAAGALGTALNEVFMPEAYWELIPVGKAAKILKKGAEAVGVLKKGERVAEKAREAEKAKGKEGGYVESRRMKEHDVKCFKKNPKGDPAEYDRQLTDQQNGLNDLSVKDYLEGRQRYQEIGRQGTGAAQRQAREKYSNELRTGFERQLEKKGVTGAAAQQQAAQMAKERMDTLAALHNPDMIAGGKDVVTSMGDKGVNSSIGSQWKDRVGELDKAAQQVPANERGNTKMNAKLKRCK